jgi:very-short-patch-repair endonuclease
VKFNHKFVWGVHPGTGKKFRFDFVIDNIIVELDGDQHFIQVGKWTPPEVTRARDLIRMNQSRENGFTTIRILQRCVYYSRYDWKSDLLEAINSISPGQDIFLCKNGEYDEMIAQLKT